MNLHVVAVLSGAAWARRAYPIWSLVIIARDVLVIWALAVHGREVAD